MTWFNETASYFAGLFGYGTRQPIELDKPGADVKPQPSAPDGTARTGGQGGNYGASGVAAYAFNCCPEVPAGDYPVWRAMDADPALTISRSVIVAAFREGDKSYEAKEGTPEAWVELVQDSIDPLWAEYVRESPDALSMGWKPFEPVFARRVGRTVISDLKPLAQELTTILVRQGALAGIRNSAGADGKSVDLLGPSALVVTIDGKNRYYYGRPWHENARKAWWDKIQCLVNLAKLNKKASGIQPKVWYPPAADEATNQTNEKQARTLSTNLMSGNGIVMPNATGSLTPELAADFRNIQGMAEAGLWKVEIEDFGNTGPQAESLLNQLRYHNAELSRGWHVPERAVQEAVTAGSRADSETHGDVALMMSQLVFNDLCAALQPVVDFILVENFGEGARGAVKVAAGRLSDVFAEGDWKLIDAVLAQPDLFAAVAEQVDLDAVFTRRGIPKNKGTLTLTEAIKQRQQQRQQQQAAQVAAAAGGAANADAVGKVNGNGQRMALARGVELIGRVLGGEDGHDDE